MITEQRVNAGPGPHPGVRGLLNTGGEEQMQGPGRDLFTLELNKEFSKPKAGGKAFQA